MQVRFEPNGSETQDPDMGFECHGACSLPVPFPNSGYWKSYLETTWSLIWDQNCGNQKNLSPKSECVSTAQGRVRG